MPIKIHLAVVGGMLTSKVLTRTKLNNAGMGGTEIRRNTPAATRHNCESKYSPGSPIVHTMEKTVTCPRSTTKMFLALRSPTQPREEGQASMFNAHIALHSSLRHVSCHVGAGLTGGLGRFLT
mmetsp:Transcript_10385/g.22757  ORF Transcript_10385/g.22757 Transcript_10385/m.22757 type:complete len:123 (-) Transcript_10385:138-506(-)